MNARPIQPSASRPRRAGFTLIELLTAGMIAVVLLGSSLKIFGGAVDSWSSYQAQIDVDREARAALQIIAEDLSALYTGSGSDIVLPLQISVDEAGKASGLEPKEALRSHSNELAFAKARTEDARDRQGDSSDVNLVAYYLSVTPDPASASSQQTTYSQKLYRYYRNSDQSFDSSGATPPDIEDVDPEQPDILDFYAHLTDGATGPLPEIAPPATKSFASASTPEPGNGQMHPNDEAVAFNVVQFRVIPYFMGGDPYGPGINVCISPTANVATGTTKDQLWPYGGPEEPVSPVYSGVPNYVDIILKVTPNRTAAKFAQTDKPDDWRGLGILKGLLSDGDDCACTDDAQKIKTYTTRVHLLSGGDPAGCVIGH